MPDHAPSHPDDQGVGQAAAAAVGGVTTGRLKQGWAFQFGYITCIVQAVRKAKGASWMQVRTIAPKL